MKRKIIHLSVLLAMTILALPAAAAPAAAGDEANGRWGLLFNAKNLLALDGFEDGYQGGAGVKFWASPSIAARALLSVDSNTPKDSTISTTILGLGLAGEWHPKRAEVSPYLGPLVGLRTILQTNQTTEADFYFGGLFGAEIKLLGPIWAFAEYDLIVSFDANGSSVYLGTDGSGVGKALIGFVVYF